MLLRSFNDIDLNGKTVLVRVDFNVPLDEDSNVTDVTRICAHVSTINELRSKGAKVILASHLGRPKGQYVEKYSLKPVVNKVAEALNCDVVFVSDCIGPLVKDAVDKMKANEVILLENLRFHLEEEMNDIGFAKKLADCADVFVMDAFSVAHRAHASTSAITNFIPSYAGHLIDREISMLSEVRDNPKHPFVLILGGSKVSDKIAVIDNMLDKVDTILIGGGMAFTFLKAQGYEIGKSLCEVDKLDFAKNMLNKADEFNVQIIIPTDVVAAAAFSNDAEFECVPVSKIPVESMGLDIGLESAKQFADVIKNAETVLWNGPMGVFEMDNFAKGSATVAKALVDATKDNGATTVVGGGDSAAAITMFGLEKQVSHVSTGGGASLKFFEGKDLPGITPYIIK